MASQIPFDTLQGNELTPSVAVETNLTAGLNGLPNTTKVLLLVGAKLSAGSATDGEIHKVTSAAQADDLFGAGSRLAGMLAMSFLVAPRVPRYAMSVPEGTTAAGPTGGGTGKLTITGTKATAAGTLVVTLGGRRYQLGVAVDDTLAEVRTALRAVIDADVHRYITSSDSSTDAIAFDARNKGPEGNSIGLRVESFGIAGLTFTMSGAKLTGGATYAVWGDPNFCLANLATQRFHIIAIDSNDSTESTGNLAIAIAHVESMSQPLTQKWGMVIAGEGSTGSTAIALAARGASSYRSQVCHLQNAENPGWELAAALAAERARILDPAESLDNHILPGILPPFAKKDWATDAEIEAALQGGVTPLRPRLDGTVEVVRSITNRTTEPIAYRDHNITEISDYVDEDLIAQFIRKWHGKKLKSLSPPGTPNTVTPARALGLLHERMRLWDASDLTQGAETDIQAGRTAAEVNEQDPDRLDLAYPFRPVYRAHRIYILKTLTTPDLV